MFPALFLDRDGVIIENRPGYVRTWSDVSIYPQALAALVSIRESPYKIVIVTNQSAVGRGLISLQTARQINERLLEELEAAGARIDGVYMCPHAPEEHCPCRKPKPGLLLVAAKELSLDLPRSILIGDALTDISAGQTAGVPRTILLRTGRGAVQAAKSAASGLKPFLVYNNLSEALADLDLH